MQSNLIEQIQKNESFYSKGAIALFENTPKGEFFNSIKDAQFFYNRLIRSGQMNLHFASGGKYEGLLKYVEKGVLPKFSIGEKYGYRTTLVSHKGYNFHNVAPVFYDVKSRNYLLTDLPIDKKLVYKGVEFFPYANSFFLDGSISRMYFERLISLDEVKELVKLIVDSVREDLHLIKDMRTKAMVLQATEPTKIRMEHKDINCNFVGRTKLSIGALIYQYVFQDPHKRLYTKSKVWGWDINGKIEHFFSSKKLWYDPNWTNQRERLQLGLAYQVGKSIEDNGLTHQEITRAGQEIVQDRIKALDYMDEHKETKTEGGLLDYNLMLIMADMLDDAIISFDMTSANLSHSAMLLNDPLFFDYLGYNGKVKKSGYRAFRKALDEVLGTDNKNASKYGFIVFNYGGGAYAVRKEMSKYGVWTTTEKTQEILNLFLQMMPESYQFLQKFNRIKLKTKYILMPELKGYQEALL